MYRLYSDQIIAACAPQGAIATRLTVYKAMGGVKTDILEPFTEACREREKTFSRIELAPNNKNMS